MITDNSLRDTVLVLAALLTEERQDREHVDHINQTVNEDNVDEHLRIEKGLRNKIVELQEQVTTLQQERDQEITLDRVEILLAKEAILNYAVRCPGVFRALVPRIFNSEAFSTDSDTVKTRLIEEICEQCGLENKHARMLIHMIKGWNL